jgi:formylglycine-generating enzyme required for sulfatase activity
MVERCLDTWIYPNFEKKITNKNRLSTDHLRAKKCCFMTGLNLIISQGVKPMKKNRRPFSLVFGSSLILSLVFSTWQMASAQNQPKKETTGSSLAKNSIGMEFVRIPKGSFMMGSVNGNKDERPVHRVTISKAFWLGKTEVTQSQWKAVMGSLPDSMSEMEQGFFGDNKPVIRASWEDIQEYIGKLNLKGEGTYRLPTEAEWEYAARAGTTTRYSSGEDGGLLGKYAWYASNSKEFIHDVGLKPPNKWGLYDMYGNVWEWCQDWYGDYSRAAQTDPKGPATGQNRVYRGGGWLAKPFDLRPAIRNFDSPDIRKYGIGFRLVRK